jgi:hypothetical protein
MKLGDVYHVSGEDADKAIEIAKDIIRSMEVHKPISFEIGFNSLILALSGALATTEMSLENKIRLARKVGDAIVANMLEDVKGGTLN